jgi:hypothetical protein
MDKELLYAKDAIFKMIYQFCVPMKFDDEKLYIYNHCESALAASFSVIGIEENYIELMEFCKMHEDNDRAIWALYSDEPFDGVTANINYKVFKDIYESHQRCIELCSEDWDL